VTLLGIIDKLLDILRKPLKSSVDPVRRIDRRIKKLKHEQMRISQRAQTLQARTRFADLSKLVDELQQERDWELRIRST